MPSTRQGDQVGSYKILEKLGEGGMALIYKALQPALKRTVVLKKLKDPNREIINRFKKEALLSASFNQENLTAIYDFLFIGKSYYLVMEFINGEDLRTIIDCMSPLPASVAGLIILGIARGLEYTHARNIIHRDIKPSNILVSYEGEVKLIDFGVAKDDLSTRLTLTGMIVGTPAYMAPEQANGDALTAQSDLFPLGILLYEMMTGVKPFYGENNTEILAKIVQNKYIPPEQINPEIPHAFRKIIKKALHKDRSRRYSHTGELIHDLERFLPWQIRSRKKEVLSRFTEKIKKAKATSTNESLRIKQLVGLKSWPWRTIRSCVLLGTIYLTILLFMQFSKYQIGKIQVILSGSEYSVQVDDAAPTKAHASDLTIEPLMRGIHKITTQDLLNGGVNINHVPVEANTIIKMKPSFNTNRLEPQLGIITDPVDASIMINKEVIDKSSLDSLIFFPGSHEIFISHPEYHSIEDKVLLQAGQNYNIQYKLLRK